MGQPSNPLCSVPRTQIPSAHRGVKHHFAPNTALTRKLPRRATDRQYDIFTMSRRDPCPSPAARFIFIPLTLFFCLLKHVLVAAHNFLESEVENDAIDVSEALVDASGKLRAISPTVAVSSSSTSNDPGGPGHCGKGKEPTTFGTTYRKKKSKFKKLRKKGYVKIARQIEYQRKVEQAVGSSSFSGKFQPDIWKFLLVLSWRN